MAGPRSDVDPLVRFFCCDRQNGRFGPYAPLRGRGEGARRTELLPGSVWRYRLVDEAALPVDLHVCTGLGDGGGLLWDLEARTLLQLGARRVAGLPEVLDGGYVCAEETSRVMPGVDGLAVVATRAADYSFTDEHAAAHMARDPALAVRVLARLAEGLAALHAQGIVHGSLWPGAIYVAAETVMDNADVECWLAHFEMASLLANHARLGNDAPSPGANGTRYTAPELRALTAAPKPNQVAQGDIYSLAAIAAGWFGGGLKEEPADVSRWAVLLERKPRAPALLTRLLLEMLDVPELRPDAAEVARRLRDVDQVVSASRDASPAQSPHLLFYLPDMGQALARLKWVASTPGTAEERSETASWIAADLRDGRLLYSPRGATPFVTGPLEATSEARYVLVGDRAAWFCTLYRELEFPGKLGPPSQQALVLKYFVQLPSEPLEALLRSNPRHHLPAVEAIPFDIARPLRESAVTNSPNWAPLLDALAPQIPADEALFDEAIDWLLRYQHSMLRARCYACALVDNGEAVEVRTDSIRDDEWVRRDTLLSHYARIPSNRPGLGDFLAGLYAEDPTLVQLTSDVGGRPAWAEYGSLWFAERAGLDRVALRPADAGNRPPPSRCWIRPADDAAAEAQLRSQARAVEELRQMPLLRSQLREPRSIRIGSPAWLTATALLPRESATAIEEMLAYYPFYALQGPPGTGKTMIAAKAIAAWLRANPNGRVLVSAQSNFALDALAERVLAELGALSDDGRPVSGDPVLAWRPTPADGVRVSPAMRAWTSSPLADRVAHHARAEVAATLATSLEPRLREVLSRWQGMLNEPRVAQELADRLPRSANLVFATCAMCRPSVINPQQERDLFDWVVVEEAARAWPTELALPLTRAARWTLIGDHRQLPAYGRERLDRFLDLLESDPLQEVAVTADRRRAYARVFDLFQSLFDTEARPGAPRRPVRRLSVQYRMTGPISRLVGEAFYPVPGKVDSQPSSGLLYGGQPWTSPLSAPAALANRSLVWIDTHGRPECRDEPFWANPGEAALVARLVESMKPPIASASGQAGHQLAVLTPYRRQLELLSQWPTLYGQAWTAHSFQGREAEIVVVSLVRDTQRAAERNDQDRPWLSLGHLSQPQLVNAMLSRARSLLVLVGDFEHFARYEQTVWGQICRTVLEENAIVPANDLFVPEEG